MIQKSPLMSVVAVVNITWSSPPSPTVNTCTSLREAYTENTYRDTCSHGLVVSLREAYHTRPGDFSQRGLSHMAWWFPSERPITQGLVASLREEYHTWPGGFSQRGVSHKAWWLLSERSITHGLVASLREGYTENTCRNTHHKMPGGLLGKGLGFLEDDHHLYGE